MRSSDLAGKRVVAEDGRRLGRVDEIHLKGGQVVALTYGRSGMLQRFMNSRRGHRLEWSRVRKVTADAIVVAD